MSALNVTADAALGEVLLSRCRSGWSELIRTLTPDEADALGTQLKAAASTARDARPLSHRSPADVAEALERR